MITRSLSPAAHLFLLFLCSRLLFCCFAARTLCFHLEELTPLSCVLIYTRICTSSNNYFTLVVPPALDSTHFADVNLEISVRLLTTEQQLKDPYYLHYPSPRPHFQSLIQSFAILCFEIFLHQIQSNYSILRIGGSSATEQFQTLNSNPGRILKRNPPHLSRRTSSEFVCCAQPCEPQKHNAYIIEGPLI